MPILDSKALINGTWNLPNQTSSDIYPYTELDSKKSRNSLSHTVLPNNIIFFIYCAINDGSNSPTLLFQLATDDSGKKRELKTLSKWKKCFCQQLN